LIRNPFILAYLLDHLVLLVPSYRKGFVIEPSS